MRYSASDKTEIIRLVEQSPWPARRTLEKLGIPRSPFYRGYDRYRRGGLAISRIAPHGRIGFGTESRRLSAVRLSTWRGINPNSARENWRCASRTRKNTLSQRRRSIGFLKAHDLIASPAYESLANLTPADVYFGRAETILLERERIKRQTIANRRLQHHLHAA